MVTRAVLCKHHARSFISSSGRCAFAAGGDSSRLQKEFDDFASTLSMYCTALNLRSTSICTAPILSTLVTECCELVVETRATVVRRQQWT